MFHGTAVVAVHATELVGELAEPAGTAAHRSQHVGVAESVRHSPKLYWVVVDPPVRLHSHIDPSPGRKVMPAAVVADLSAGAVGMTGDYAWVMRPRGLFRDRGQNNPLL